ncbi:T6SS effector BTH_I2691 family protein [Chitinibacteraceae bacterium HSL-7]
MANCTYCNKSELSLLLLRPSPIANEKSLQPAGLKCSSNPAHVEGLVPTVKMSRYGLRLLREGFVYVFIPAQKRWLTYRVTEHGDILEEKNPAFKAATQAPCQKAGHNYEGMKLLRLPDAHTLIGQAIWIAYSANRWNAKVKQQNAADPKVMQKVVLGQNNPNSFKPDEKALREHVLEAGHSSLTVPKVAAPFYRFNTLLTKPKDGGKPGETSKNTDGAAKLAAQLSTAAARSGKTAGKELAIVLQDRVGVAAELNALRLARRKVYELAVENHAHKLNSYQTISGMRSHLFDSNQPIFQDKIAPYIRAADFDAHIAARARYNPYPAGTFFVPLTPQELRAAQEKGVVYQRPDGNWYHVESSGMGRIYTPDFAMRLQKAIDRQVGIEWDRDYAKHVDWTRANKEMQALTKQFDSEHFSVIAKYETDWTQAAFDPNTKRYFTEHFDPSDPNKPTDSFSSGTVYAMESSSIHTPEPYSDGKALEDYIREANSELSDKGAVLVRATLFNQQVVIDSIHQSLTAASNGDDGGMRDKVFDCLKGLVDKLDGQRFSWAINSTLALSMGQVTAMAAVATSIAAQQSASLSAAADRLALRTMQFAATQSAISHLADAATHHGRGSIPPAPLLLEVEVDPSLAKKLKASMGGGIRHTRTYLKQAAKLGNKVKLYILTDSKALIDFLTKNLSLSSSEIAALGAISSAPGAASAALAKLTNEQLLTLYHGQASASHKIIGGVRASYATGRSAAGAHGIFGSLEGRFAIASLIVQSIGMMRGMKAVENSDETTYWDNLLGLSDSALGVTAALTEAWSVAATHQLVTKVGTDAATAAVENSTKILGLRAMVSLLGAAAGYLNVYIAWRKRKASQQKGDTDQAWRYGASGAAFAGLATTATLLFAQQLAATVVVAVGTRGATSGVIIGLSAVARVGTLAVGGIAVASILTGVGLVLLIGGTILQIWAAASEPTVLQRWLRRSYFGIGEQRFKTWSEERKALDQLLNDLEQQTKLAANQPKPARRPGTPVVPIINSNAL